MENIDSSSKNSQRINFKAKIVHKLNEKREEESNRLKP